MPVGEVIGLQVELERVAEQRVVADEDPRVDRAQREGDEDDRAECEAEAAGGHAAGTASAEAARRRARQVDAAACRPTAARTSTAGSKAWRSRGIP